MGERASRAEAIRHLYQADPLAGFHHRQGSQQQGVRQTEKRSVQPDAEAKQQNHAGKEAGESRPSRTVWRGS